MAIEGQQGEACWPSGLRRPLGYPLGSPAEVRDPRGAGNYEILVVCLSQGLTCRNIISVYRAWAGADD